jgi:hypothetical protein
MNVCTIAPASSFPNSMTNLAKSHQRCYQLGKAGEKVTCGWQPAKRTFLCEEKNAFLRVHTSVLTLQAA